MEPNTGSIPMISSLARYGNENCHGQSGSWTRANQVHERGPIRFMNGQSGSWTRAPYSASSLLLDRKILTILDDAPAHSTLHITLYIHSNDPTIHFKTSIKVKWPFYITFSTVSTINLIYLHMTHLCIVYLWFPPCKSWDHNISSILFRAPQSTCKKY